LTLIHAITPQERDQVAPQFPGLRVVVIPNAIDLSEADAALREQPEAPVAGPYLLFLSRLHPKKGIDLLIAAFARAAGRRNFRLLIVGPDSSRAYTAQLQAQADSLGLKDRVIFHGPVFGPGKWQLYRHAWAFCLPSRSEVVGLVNLEAAAVRVPVITTHETGLADWEQGGGLLIHSRVEELTRALEEVFSWSESERQSRGQNLRQLVEQGYSWESVGPRWLELYAGL
jgi:glycosyltransferase involved in cell wall biosynthesis